MKRLVFLLLLPFLAFAHPTKKDLTLEDALALKAEDASGWSETDHQKKERFNEMFFDAVMPYGRTFSVSDLSVSRLVEYNALIGFHSGRTESFYGSLYDAYVADRKKLGRDYITFNEWELLTFEEKENIYFAVYYVTASGSSANNGLSEGSAWTLPHAFATAQAGDIVHIKAGSYGALQITTSNAGSSGNVITFQGYQNTAGDIVATNGPTFDFDDWKANGEALNTSLMPFLNNNDDTPEYGEHAFELEHDYITIKNLMMAKYRIGFNMDANNLTLDNVIGDQFGTWDPAAFCWNAVDDGCTDPVDPSYHRNGWAVNSAGNPQNMTIRNSLFIDAGMVCIFLIGADNALIENCEGISYNTGNGSDYLFDLYRSDNVTMRNCYAYRFEDPNNGHRCRGFIAQGDCNDVLVENFVSENVRCQVTHSTRVTVRGLEIKASAGANGNENDGALQISSGTRDSNFYNVSIDGAGGLQFLGYANPLNETFPFTTSQSNCFFVNFKITNMTASGSGVISFHRLSSNSTMSAGTFYCIGWTVDDYEWLINANRAGDARFYNSTFSNGNNASFDTRVTGGSWGDGLNTYEARFTNCNWAPSNNASIPTGSQWTQTNVINVDPQFTNAAAGDYTIPDGGNLANMGTSTTGLLAGSNIDFNNNTRGNPPDIGAYEEGSTGGSTCNDGIQNGDETGIDCGGSCPNSCPVSPTSTGLMSARRRF